MSESTVRPTGEGDTTPSTTSSTPSRRVAIPEGIYVEAVDLKTCDPPDFRELVGQAVVSPIRADIKLEPWPPS